MQRVFKHLHHGDIVIDAEDCRDLSMLVMDIDRRRFQGFSVFRAGQIAELVAHLIVIVPDLLEDHVRRSVADLSPGNMSVLNGDDGAVGALFRYFMHHNLTIRSELRSDAFRDLAQHFQKSRVQ